jgi:anti-repressor protein
MGATALSELEIFQFPATGAGVRTVLRDGEPSFVAADVCAVLGYGGGARNAVARLPERMKGVADVNTPGGVQKLVILSEAGVYRLVMRSTMPMAEAFQDWLSEEVVPQIRMTGRYEPTPTLPQTYAQALRELASTVERAEDAERALAIAEPKAEAWQVLASAEGDYSVREAAYVLNRDPAIDTGQKRLFALLREWRLLDRNNKPYSTHAKHVCLRATHYTHPSTGEEMSDTQVRITHAGLQYLHKRMGGVKQLQLVFPSEAA